jgi:hypothetical protein
MSKRATAVADVIEVLAEQLGADMDRHLFSWRAPFFLQLKLDRLGQVYGKATVRAALALRYRLDRASYREGLRQHRELTRQQSERHG